MRDEFVSVKAFVDNVHIFKVTLFVVQLEVILSSNTGSNTMLDGLSILMLKGPVCQIWRHLVVGKYTASVLLMLLTECFLMSHLTYFSYTSFDIRAKSQNCSYVVSIWPPPGSTGKVDPLFKPIKMFIIIE